MLVYTYVRALNERGVPFVPHLNLTAIRAHRGTVFYTLPDWPREIYLFPFNSSRSVARYII